MKLTLTTYDSVVCHIAGYADSANCLQMANTLQNLANEFSAATGVPIKNVNWWHVTDSDWCKYMLVIYATVPTDWQPTKDTFVIDESYCPTWFAHTCKPFNFYIKGRGECLNVNNQPPKKPHQLFRTIVTP